MQKQNRLAHVLAAAILAACVLPTAGAQDNASYKAAIEHKAREADRKDDARRKPAEFLAFAQVKPGMQVLDVSAGGGATSQLLALAVGERGTVWAQNPKESEKLKQRLAANPQANIKPVVAPFHSPVPAGTPPLDLVVINMSYHDIVNSPADRDAMNKALFNALKPGGKLVIIDNAAKAGAGIGATKTLHRIEEAAVIEEVTRAGFTVDGRSDYLHVASDPREQPFFQMKGAPDDKFAVRFVRK
ncbi:MAG TPA: methyltransferase domain-containing protein [Telluria sp.]